MTDSRVERLVQVYLCDDVPELRHLLRLILEEDGEICVVGEAGDGATAVEEIAALKPAVVILDLSMPGMHGLEALPLIRRVAPDTRVIVFSGFTEERMASAALAGGAARYIEKGKPLEQVRRAVRELTISR